MYDLNYMELNMHTQAQAKMTPMASPPPLRRARRKHPRASSLCRTCDLRPSFACADKI